MTTSLGFPIRLLDAGPIDDGAAPALPELGQHRQAMLGELSWLLDPLCVVAAAALATLLHARWRIDPGLDGAFGAVAAPAAWLAAVLAPFMLRDRHFGARAGRGQVARIARTHALRLAGLSLALLALGGASGALQHVPGTWMLLWLAAVGVSTSLTRQLVASWVGRRLRQGHLSEVVAVVGAGVVADRLVQELGRKPARSVELLGVFDDRRARAGTVVPVGPLAQLIELGKTHRIDWIVLTLPPTAEQRLHLTVQRLKALSAPIGLCPQHIGQAPPASGEGPAGEPAAGHALLGEMLPRWMVTLLELAGAAVTALVRRLLALLRPAAAPVAGALTLTFDRLDLDSFTRVAASHGQQRYGYVVTPNADHLIRLHDEASFAALYAAADHVLLDSRFLAHLLRRTRGIELPVCPGSDLTARLFAEVIGPDDALVLIGGSAAQAAELARRHGLVRLAHLNPPMGFIHDPQAVEECLRFVEAHSPFRFCLLALGSPQQEMVAQRLKERGRARGLALCIGASINFLTGDERRAPRWMQRGGIEWLYRLLQDPRRLGARYLLRGPRVFALLRRAEIVQRAHLG